MMTVQVFWPHRAKEKAIQVPAREGQSLERDLVQKEQGAWVELKKLPAVSSLRGAAHLQEARGVILLDHLQAVLHQACGLTQLQCAVIDLVPNHLQRRESSEEPLVGKRSQLHRQCASGRWTAGKGAVDLPHLIASILLGS